MTSHEITHSRKDGRDPDRRLDGFLIGGSYYNVNQVLSWIVSRQHQFFVRARGQVVAVIAKRHALTGRWYLTTEPDGFPMNNLLRLPDC